jgi:hypothetical protein
MNQMKKGNGTWVYVVNTREITDFTISLRGQQNEGTFRIFTATI